MNTPAVTSPSFQVRFASLFVQGRAFAFPCDAKGRVDLEAMTELARNNYFYARAMVGRDYSMPCVFSPANA